MEGEKGWLYCRVESKLDIWGWGEKKGIHVRESREEVRGERERGGGTVNL